MKKRNRNRSFPSAKERQASPKTTLLRLEELETRELLSASPVASNAATALVAAAYDEQIIELPNFDVPNAPENTAISIDNPDFNPDSFDFESALSELQAAEVYTTTNYATIFIGATDGERSYNAAKKMFETLTETMRVSPDNVFIFFGDAASREGRDWSFAKNVADANFENLNDAFAYLNQVMNPESNLVFVATDNGAVDQTLYCDRGATITGAQLRDALYQIRSGSVTCLFPKRDPGDVVDALFDPETSLSYQEYDNAAGERVVYNGNAVFAYEAVYSLEISDSEQGGELESEIVLSYANDDVEIEEIDDCGEISDDVVGEYLVEARSVVEKIWHEGKKVVRKLGRSLGSFAEKALSKISPKIGKAANQLITGHISDASKTLWNSKFELLASAVGACFGGPSGAALGGGLGSVLDNGITKENILQVVTSSMDAFVGSEFASSLLSTAKSFVTDSTFVQNALKNVDKVISVVKKTVDSVTVSVGNLALDLGATDLGYRIKNTDVWETISTAGKKYIEEGKWKVTLNNLISNEIYELYAKFKVPANGSVVEIVTPNVTFVASPQVETPTNIQVVKESSTQLKVNWAPVQRATGYEIVATNAKTGATITQTVAKTENSYLISGLQDATEYTIQVRSKGGENVVVGKRLEKGKGNGLFKFRVVNDYAYLADSLWAETTASTPITLQLAPIAPTGNATDVMNAVQWSVPLNGGDVMQHIDGYEMRYRTVGGAWKTVTLTENNDVSDLKSGLYEFQYRPILKDDKYMPAAVDKDGWPIDTTSYFTVFGLRNLVQSTSDSANVGASLRQAINELNASGDGNLIILTEELKGKTITLGSTLSINKSVTIDASRCLNADGTPGVTINANGKQAFNFGSGATNVVLNGLKIINAGSASTNGGAIFSEAKNLTVTNCEFDGNKGADGGAIYLKGTSGTLNVTIKNNVFTNNKAVKSGAAIFVNANNSTGAISILNSQFIDNKSAFNNNSFDENSATAFNNSSRHGAAVYFWNEKATNKTPTVSIDASSFRSNKSVVAEGGAVVFDKFGAATITNSDFDGNVAKERGGAIFIENCGANGLKIESTRFTHNDSGAGGGAICGETNSSIVIGAGTVFDGNSARFGGAIFTNNNTLTCEKAIFSNNQSSISENSGGAIKLDGTSATIIDTLFYGNQAYRGAAVSIDSVGAANDAQTKLSLLSATFVDNTATSGGDSLQIITSRSNKKATVEAHNSIFLSESTDEIDVQGTQASISGDYILARDLGEWGAVSHSITYDPTRPLFADRENNDYTLAEGSQAINAGWDNYARDGAVAEGYRDLAGNARQIGGRQDVGAFEYQTLAPKTWTVSTTTDSATTEGSLRYVLARAHEGDTIVFDESLRGKTIKLNGELTITEGVTLDATALWDDENDEPGLTLSGENASRVFHVSQYAGSPTIKGLTLANGSADAGGAIYKDVDANLTLERCYVVNNKALTGGGGGVRTVGGELFVVDCLFNGNASLSTATSAWGAGVSGYQGDVTITSSVFERNISAYEGGAAQVEDGNLRVDSSEIRYNQARQLGALKVRSGNLTVRNSLIANNSGDGTVHLYKHGTISIVNSTIVNNASGARPTISICTDGKYQTSVSNIYNSIVAFNTQNNNKQVGVWSAEYGSQTYNYHNVLSTQNIGSANGNVYYTGTAAALFADPTNGDYRLNPDSVAVNAGSNAYVSGDFDLSGAERIQANQVDLGAYETTGRTIVVTSGSDDATDEGSLRYAIDHARHGDYITFAGALRGSTIMLSQQLVITKTVTIDGVGSDLTFDGGGATRAFYVNAPGQEVVFKGLTFTRGLSGSINSGVENADAGGALENYRGAVSLIDCVFEGNVGYFGGAVLNHETMTIDGCEFLQNESYYGGGAIFNGAKTGAGQTWNATLTVKDTRFVENVADAYVDKDAESVVDSNIGWRFGGAILNYKGALTISNAEFLRNETHGDDGGAIYNEQGTVTIRESLFDGNYSPNVGGAIENHQGSMAIYDSELTNNVAFNGHKSATGSGGGAILNDGGVLNIEGSSLTNNYSRNYYGGAIYSVDGTLRITKSVLSGNAAGFLANGELVPETGGAYGGGAGGAIFVHRKTASVESYAAISNSIISRNVAANGGGIVVQNANVDLVNVDVVYNESKDKAGGLVVDPTSKASLTASTVNVINSIVVGNSLIGQTTRNDVKRGSAATLNSINTISGWATRSQWTIGGTDFYYNESRPLFVDPDNDDFTLAADSQAIDRGISYNGVSETDLAEFERVVNNRIDLGPYELQTYRTPQQIVVTSGSDANVNGSLSRALSIAQPGDTIVFAASLKGQTIKISNELVVAQSVTIDASACLNADGTPGVTISGQGVSRIVYVDALAEDVTIKGLKFVNGSSDAEGGGAIFARDVNLTISNCVFENNQALSFGGAINAIMSSSDAKVVLIEGSTFENNRVKISDDSSSGGAICVASTSAAARHNLIVIDSRLIRNVAEEDANKGLGQGGAIYAYGVDVEIERSFMEENTAYFGGATFSLFGDVKMTNSIVACNTASSGGAAIYLYNDVSSSAASLQLYNTTAVGNVSSGDYGAIYLDARNTGTVRLEAYNSILAYSSKTTDAPFMNGNADVYVMTQTNGKVVTTARNVLTNYKGWTFGMGVVNSADYAFDAVLRRDVDEWTGAPKYSLRETSIARDNYCLNGQSEYFNSFVVSDFDVRGAARVVDGYVDMGAYEFYDPDNPDCAKLSLPTITIDGEPRVGATLSVKFDSGVAPTATYQWYYKTDANAWQAIAGATDQEYEPTAELAGRKLKVIARPSGYFSGAARSAQTRSTVVLPLDAPTLTVASVAPNAITLEWNAVPLAETYVAQYRATESNAWTTLNSEINGDDQTLRIKAIDLTPNASYEFRVMTIGKEGVSLDSAFGAAIVASTVDDALILNGIEGDYELGGVLTAQLAREGVSATYQWYRSTDVEGEWQAISGATSASYQTKAADLGRQLRVDATATGEDGYSGSESAYSPRFVWKTLEAPTLTATATGSDSMSITWSNVEGATDYEIAIRNVESEDWFVIDELEGYDGCECSELDVYGTYELKIIALGDGLVYYPSDYSDVTRVTLGVTKLDAPSITSASWANDSLTVNWLPIEGASKYFLQYKSAEATTYTTVSVNKSLSSYTITGLAQGAQYHVRINAIGSGSYTSSGYGDVATVSKLGTPDIVSTSAGVGEITVQWNPIEGATKYYLQYKTTDSATYTTVSVNNATSITITGLSYGSEYQIRLNAIGSGLTLSSGYGETAVVTVGVPKLSAPEIVSTSWADDAITINWTPIDGASKYYLQYKEESQTSFTTLSVNKSLSSYTINGLTKDATYQFRLNAIGSDSAQSSGYGEIASVTLGAIKLSAPTILETTATNNSITVNWTEVPGATKYTIAYAPQGSEIFTLKTTTATSYAIPGLAKGATYQLKIRTVGDGTYFKTSEFGDITTATTLANEPIQLAKPVLVVDRVANSDSTDAANFEWNRIEGAVGYELLYKTKYATAYSTIDLPAESTSYAIADLDGTEIYYFRIRAIGDGANTTTSAYSATVSSYPANALDVPKFSITYWTTDSITVQWNAVEGAAKYYLAYAPEGSSSFTTKSIPAPNTSFTLSGLSQGETYRFKARAIADKSLGVLNSSYGAETTITTGPSKLAPPDVVSLAATANSITVSWNALDGAKKYYVAYAEEGAATFVQKSSATTSLTITGLNPDRTYQIKVRAVADGTTATVGSDFGAVKTISTTTLAPSSLTPPSVSVTSRSGDAISIAWNAVDGAAGYALQYRKVGESITTLNLPANVTSYTPTGLDSTASYQFRARALGDGLNSLSSTYGEWTLSKPIVTLATPQIGEITTTANSITFSWRPISGAVKYYVAYAPIGSSSLTTKSTTATSFTLQNLPFGAEYRFKARAVGNGETTLNSVWSDYEYAETTVSDAILELADDLFDEFDEADAFEDLDLIAEALL